MGYTHILCNWTVEHPIYVLDNHNIDNDSFDSEYMYISKNVLISFYATHCIRDGNNSCRRNKTPLAIMYRSPVCIDSILQPHKIKVVLLDLLRLFAFLVGTG